LVLGVTLMLLVAMGSVAMAEIDDAALSIGADVATFGEIRDWPEFLDLGTLSGEAGDEKDAETDRFRIVRNDALLITLNLIKPLTSQYEIDIIDWFPPNAQVRVQLGTTVTLSQQVVKRFLGFPVGAEWKERIVVSAGPNVPDNPIGSFVTSDYGDYVLGKLVGAIGYKIKVHAVLGDIDDQPAGGYEGEVVLTISAPLS
ncbi:MAG: hypothetical protein WAQ30_00045, partial [Bacillota bacterium]